MEKPRASLAAQVVLFSLIRTVVNTSYRMIYPYLSTFQAGLGVGLPAISLVLTVRSLLGFAGPFLAQLADHRGRRTSMLLGAGAFTAGALIVVIFPTYAGFFASLVLMALAYLVFLPAMQAYLSDRVPYTRRGRVLGLTELSWSAAFIAGVPLAGWLLARTGQWNAPFPLLAGLGGLAVIGLLIFVRHDGPVAGQETKRKPPSIRALLVVPGVRAGLLMALMITAANETVNLVFGIWLEDRFAFKLAALGAASVVIGLSEMGGEGLSAWLVDRLGKQWSIRTGLVINCLAAAGLIFLSGTSWGALLGLFVFYMTFEFTLVSMLPMMSEALPGLRATVMATTIACLALGRAVGTQLAPLIYQQFGFTANTIAAIGFNLVALLLLTQVKVGEQPEKTHLPPV